MFYPVSTSSCLVNRLFIHTAKIQVRKVDKRMLSISQRLNSILASSTSLKKYIKITAGIGGILGASIGTMLTAHSSCDENSYSKTAVTIAVCLPIFVTLSAEMGMLAGPFSPPIGAMYLYYLHQNKTVEEKK